MLFGSNKKPPAAPSQVRRTPTVPAPGQARPELRARTTITPPTLGRGTAPIMPSALPANQHNGAPAPQPAPMPPQPVPVPAEAGQQVVYGAPAEDPRNYQANAHAQVQAAQAPAFNPVPELQYDGSIPNVAGPVNDPQDDVMQYTPSSENFWSGVKGIFSIIALVATAFLLAGAINRYVFQSYQVFGKSMETTLSTDDRLIVSKLGKSLNNLVGSDFVPDRYEVVVFDSSKEATGQLVKRVIGLPGERVTVEQGLITVYNVEFPDGFNPDVDERYADFLPAENLRTGDVDITLGEKEIFVAGDNRTAGSSLDSRNSLGPVLLDDVVGSVVLRIFPLAEARTF